jgi:hypothetical protein
MIKVKRDVLDVSMDVIGRPGGFARAKKLSPERRKEIARQAANKRWNTKRIRIEIK